MPKASAKIAAVIFGGIISHMASDHVTRDSELHFPERYGSTYWCPALALGMLQLPWFLIWGFRLLGMRSARHVELVKDSLQESVYLFFTVPAILIGILGLVRAIQSRELPHAVFSAASILLAASFFVFIAWRWYNDIWIWRNGDWGLW